MFLWLRQDFEIWIDCSVSNFSNIFFYSILISFFCISGAIKTTAQLKKICEIQFEFSRWINDRCYFFHNKEVPSFDDSQKICSDTFKQHGFDNGRVYEPRDSDNFDVVYALAEEFSKRPTLQLWIGLNDKEKDGQFVFNSNGRLPRYAPWKYGSHTVLLEYSNIKE